MRLKKLILLISVVLLLSSLALTGCVDEDEWADMQNKTLENQRVELPPNATPIATKQASQEIGK